MTLDEAIAAKGSGEVTRLTVPDALARAERMGLVARRHAAEGGSASW